MKKYRLITICFVLVSIAIIAQENQVQVDVKSTKLELTKQGKELLIEAYIPRGITEFELRIESDRNNPVSSARDIIPSDPDPAARAANFEISSLDVRYPVVDV